jgi:hypothetical protein
MSLLVPVAVLVVLAAAVAVGAWRLRAMGAAGRSAQERAAALRTRAVGATDALRAAASVARPTSDPGDAAVDDRLSAALADADLRFGAVDEDVAERRPEVRPDTRSDDRRRSRPTRTPSPRLRRDP